MNQRAYEVLDLISQLVIMVAVVITPLLMWNLTTEFYETPKLLLTMAVTAALLVVWVLKSLVSGKVTIKRTPLDIPLLILLVILAVSTFFSPARSLAIVGNLPRLHGGLASMVTYILLYFAIVWNVRQKDFAQKVLYMVIFSGVILSVLTLLSYAGIDFLGLSFSKGLNFTPAGTSFSVVAILVLALPILLFGIVGGPRNEIIEAASQKDFLGSSAVSKLVLTIMLTLFGTVIVLTGSIAGLLGAVGACALVLLVTPVSNLQKNLAFLVTPLLVIILLALVTFIQIGGSKNLLYAQSQNYPREIQLPFAISWKVSVSAFRDAPFWGTSPGSFLNNFTIYKPIEFNAFKYWNVRFDQPYNEYLQFLATLGAPGLISLGLLLVIFASIAFRKLSAANQSSQLVEKALGAAGITFFVLLAFHASTLLVWVFGIIMLALFMTTDREVAEELEVGIAATKRNLEQFTLRFDALPIILLGLMVVGFGTVGYYTGKYVLADYHHRQALNAVTANDGLTAYNELIKSEQLNPYIDLYRVDLAQTNFALANAIAAQKGPSSENPNGTLTDTDKQNIQQLLSQSITEGKAAVALNPRSAANLEVLGSIYRQIAGVAQNALSFALDSYGLAVQRDPLNPLLRLTVGGIYYSAKSYDMAIRFFTDTVNLKPDFANGYYNLAIALKDKGDLTNATLAAERTVALIDPKTPDYKVASDLLASLKAATASVSAAQATQTPPPPASQTNSALDNQKLPKVLDLPKPEKIATPPAVTVTLLPTPTTAPKATPTPTP